jgi:hypothetical protein
MPLAAAYWDLAALLDDNHFCLCPGEVRRATIDWQDVPPGERRLRVAGWNTPEVVVTE